MKTMEETRMRTGREVCSFSLNPKTKAMLKELSEMEFRTMSAIVDIAVERYYSEAKQRYGEESDE